ncbi:hypothetical protein [Rhizobium leguminosarum]|uniref:hypothetical protein n=1 Tax=Rhizobium leguminosarum TaxID=384 RepID=UPI001C95637F|nr:hypothetical protein [Rhizobium leguminosarum]
MDHLPATEKRTECDLEGFGRTDDGLCVLGEQIEEAIFPRHQFLEASSASALHRVSQTGTKPAAAREELFPKAGPARKSVGHSTHISNQQPFMTVRLGVIKCSYEHSIFAK